MNSQDIISVFLIAIGLAMDAFSVAVTDGIVIGRVKARQAIKIGLFFGVFQFFMPCIGFLLGTAFARYIKAFDHWVAFILLVFVGGKMIFEALTEKDEAEAVKDPLSNKTLTVLAIATSIDALAVGVTFATVEIPLFAAAAIIGVVAFVLSFAGVYIGSKCGNLFGNKAEIAGGVVLVGIGVKILVEHLFF
ncbi:MAG: manganese efflux pump MntP family protein [Firmicutes bacterium]|nr:manganese efflux pump MntP family protein [Bacillota bacterium]